MELTILLPDELGRRVCQLPDLDRFVAEALRRMPFTNTTTSGMISLRAPLTRSWRVTRKSFARGSSKSKKRTCGLVPGLQHDHHREPLHLKKAALSAGIP